MALVSAPSELLKFALQSLDDPDLQLPEETDTASQLTPFLNVVFAPGEGLANWNTVFVSPIFKGDTAHTANLTARCFGTS